MQEEERQKKIDRLRRAMYSRSLSGRLKPRPRRELRPLDYNVPSDWQEEQESIKEVHTAPRGITAARTFMRWLLVGAIAFFTVALGIFIYYFTIGQGGSVAAPGNIDITVQGPLSLTGGEPTELQIVVVNRNQATLELADLVITYPPGTRLPSDLVTELPRQRISLGSIEPGGSRQGTVSAVFIGSEGDRKNVHVELEYRVANSNAIFVSESDYELAFNAAPISIAVEANDEVVSGQRLVLTATVTSNVDTIVRDVLVEAQYPFGFTVESTDPEQAREGVWEIGDIRPGQEYVIEVYGTMEGQQSEERTFRFTAGTRREPTGQRIEVPLVEGVHRVAIARPFLGLGVSVNKESGGSAVAIAPGETVTVAISWVNNLTTPIGNAVLVATLDGIELSGQNIQSTNGFYRSSDRTVLWDRTTTDGDFAQLAPGERGTVNFTFTVPEEQELLDVREAELLITVHAAGQRIGQTNVPENLQASASQTVKLASNVEVVAQGFYYSNPFGSVGPLPPKVNQETTYAVVWTVANTSSVIRDAQMVGNLPPYVRWAGFHNPASEQLRFNASDGTVTWDLGTIGQGVGVGATPPRQVAFVVGLTPSESQIGQTPDIINNLVLTGIDTFAEVDVRETHPPVTTNLIDDPGFSTTESEVVAE